MSIFGKMKRIFHERYLSEYIDEVRKGLETCINGLGSNELRNTALLEELIEDFSIQPLALQPPIPKSQSESTRTVSAYGDTYQQKVYVTDMEMPFEGDVILFSCQPSESAIIYSDINIIAAKKVVHFKIVLTELNANLHAEEVQQVVKDIQRNIPNVNKEVKAWNESLPERVKSLLKNRVEEVQLTNDFMTQIGLVVRKEADEYMTPPIKKKAIPSPIPATGSKSKEVVPTLEEKVYNDIKEVLYNVGRAMERKPSLYMGKNEEALRDSLLLFLETRYESTAGVGEAFNKKGKTDILLKYAPDGRNIFVAECKFWTGPKALISALDQLLGYLTVRDTKTALIFFVNKKNFSAVIDSIECTISTHSCYKAKLAQNHESSFSYSFCLPDDPSKIIFIEIMAFHFPSI